MGAVGGEERRPGAGPVPLARVVNTAGIVGFGLAALDRLQTLRPLASVFAPLSALEQLAVFALAGAATTAAILALDLAAWGAGRARDRDGWPVGSGLAAAGLVALALEQIAGGVLGLGLFGNGAAGRAIWLGLTVALAVLTTRFFARARRDDVPASPRLAALGVAAVSLGAAGYGALVLTAAAPPARPAAHAGPNVLIVAFDGVGADRTSPYGAPPDVTPRLGALAADALIADDAFPNACHTYGSVTALLSGRSALAQGVVYWPDRLRGADAFAHLPDVLGRVGYHTAVIGAPDYVDPVDLGARGDVDLVNHTVGPRELPGLDHDTRPLVVAARMWAVDLVARAEPAAMHLLGVRTIASFTDTYTRQTPTDDDGWRIARTIAHVDAAGGAPWFAYLHLMGTHGPFFHPRARRRAPAAADGPWQPELADDALTDVDAHLGELLDALEARGQRERTLILVLSDHQEAWTCGRVPLIARFPGGAHAGRVGGPVALIDVAPTVLGAVGLPVPDAWEGVDLAAGAPPADRGVLLPWDVDTDTIPALGRNLRSVAWRRCDTAWVVPVDGGPVERRPIAGYRGACEGLPPVDDAEVGRRARGQLAAWGWSTAP